MEPSKPRVMTLVIGCGNPLCGDDAVGPVLVRRLLDRGLAEGVECVDGGTAGIDVVLRMRGVPEVIIVDACHSGGEPGTLVELRGEELENRPPPAGLSMHSFRWDHAVALARGVLADDVPARITALLVEGAAFEPGAPLSPAVDRGVDRLADRLLAGLGRSGRGVARPASAAGG